MQRKFFLFLFFSGITLIAYNQVHNLDFYLKEGLQNSPLLNDYRNQINSAVSDSLLIKAGKKPQISAKSQLQYSPYYESFGYDEVITDGGNYSAVMGVTQNLFNKRELNNKYKSLNIQKQLINNSSRISSNELNKMITEQYLISFSDYSDFQFNKTFLDLFVKENEILKRFVESGVGKHTDYLSLVIETQSQEILVNQLKSQFVKDMMLLNEICGLNDSTTYELEEPLLSVKGIPDIRNSPAFIQYKIDSLRIENERMAIDIRYKPKINWFADAGFLTSTPWNFYKHFGYSAGVSLDVPIYDGKQRGTEKQKLAFDENSRKAYENNYRNKYYQQIQRLRSELILLNEMLVQTENQIKTADQLVKALKQQLEAGIIQMTEFINAMKNFKTISRNIKLIKIQKLQIINELNFLLTQ